LAEVANMSAQNEHEHALVPYSLYVKVWATLLVLTVLTVGVSYLDMKHVTVFTALIIATVKATLVLLYFMHLRFEKPLYLYMVLAVIVTYAIFVALTFADYWFR
jgi:cytochrome c oxidase subunit 4